MKTTTKIGITFLVLSVLIIGLGSIFAKIVNDQKTLEENIEIIRETYTNFSIKIVDNYRARSELKTKLSEFSNETYADEHDEYIKLITTCNETITGLNADLAILEEKCVIEYEDAQANVFCDNYQQLYEIANNIYVDRLTAYNNKISSYNEVSEEDYELITLINKETIDFNGNGTYDGLDE